MQFPSPGLKDVADNDSSGREKRRAKAEAAWLGGIFVHALNLPQFALPVPQEGTEDPNTVSSQNFAFVFSRPYGDFAVPPIATCWLK